MKLLYEYTLIIFLFCLTDSSFGQDTTLYSNNKIRCINTNTENGILYSLFLDVNGNNILKTPALQYHYYDSTISAERFFFIRNYYLVEKYYVKSDMHGQDTIYEYIPNAYEQYKKYLDSLGVFLEKNLKYPSEALENKIQGNVLIEFTVNKNGEIINPKPASTLGYGLEEEMIITIKKYKTYGIITYKNEPINYVLNIGKTFFIR